MKVIATTAEIRSALKSVLEQDVNVDALIAEAESPITTPGRLAELAKSDYVFVQIAALKNPNTSTEACFDAFFS